LAQAQAYQVRTKPHLLVVDDDERLRALLQRYLSANGYRGQRRARRAEARALMKGMAFDLLILDVMMPGNLASTSPAACARNPPYPS